MVSIAKRFYCTALYCTALRFSTTLHYGIALSLLQIVLLCTGTRAIISTFLGMDSGGFSLGHTICKCNRLRRRFSWLNTMNSWPSPWSCINTTLNIYIVFCWPSKFVFCIWDKSVRMGKIQNPGKFSLLFKPSVHPDFFRQQSLGCFK
jgi:hypothetical protein